MLMTTFCRFPGPLGLGLLVGLLAAAPLAAAPGDAAAGQSDYKAVRSGAVSLQGARDAAANAGNKFGGHKAKAIEAINTALGELDAAVDFANSTTKPGERGDSIFDPTTHGATAASQSDYPAIQKTANRLIEAGNALDRGFDKFGGHRVKALKAIHAALDELDAAVSFANGK